MVAYILAASHSGSTLLAMLLDSHPDVCSVGELKVGALGDLDNYLCSCRRRLMACPFWSQIQERMRESGEGFDFNDPGTDIRVTDNRLLRRLLRPMVRSRPLEILRDAILTLLPAWHRHSRATRERNRSFLAALTQLSGASVVADSSKVGVRLKYLLRDKKIDVRVIRLIRDGRGVALTYINPGDFADAKEADMRSGGTGEPSDRTRVDMPDAAREWFRANKEAEAIKGFLDEEQCLEIHYEDLCTDTVATMNAVFGFLGVAANAAEIIRNVDNVEHHIVGNGMRLDNDHTIILDERWRGELSKAQLAEFDLVAGSLNAKYGYE